MQLTEYLQDVKLADEEWTFDSGVTIGILNLYRRALREAAREYNLRETPKIPVEDSEELIEEMVREKYIEINGLARDDAGVKTVDEIIDEEDAALNIATEDDDFDRSYWEAQKFREGQVFLSKNGDRYRLQVPKDRKEWLNGILKAGNVAITRGSYPEFVPLKYAALELLF